MEPTAVGDLVQVATAGPQIDGIVFDMPSATKAVVAMMDRRRGPVFRTVETDKLTPRADAGPDDRALHLLMRRTPPPSRGGRSAAQGTKPAREGHTRGAAHRSTGK